MYVYNNGLLFLFIIQTLFYLEGYFDHKMLVLTCCDRINLITLKDERNYEENKFKLITLKIKRNHEKRIFFIIIIIMRKEFKYFFQITNFTNDPNNIEGKID